MRIVPAGHTAASSHSGTLGSTPGAVLNSEINQEQNRKAHGTKQTTTKKLAHGKRAEMGHLVPPPLVGWLVSVRGVTDPKRLLMPTTQVPSSTPKTQDPAESDFLRQTTTQGRGAS